MAQEFTIKSPAIEDKINQLLPSQGGFQPGVDFSASTMVIPIVDLTESAEGSSLRQDLQTALSFTTTPFDIKNATGTTIVNTTGYYRVIGIASANFNAGDLTFFLDDGTTQKIIQNYELDINVSNQYHVFQYDFIVKIAAGETLKGTATTAFQVLKGATRQIAALDETLTNP